MALADRRFDRSAITLEHASARGRVLRNADNFTRGSQLIGHQFSMFRAGVRVPIFIWLGLFIVIYWIMLSAVMGEHEIQLCSWRLGSTLWTWVDFDPFKPMNIVMHDGAIRRTSMGYIPYLPDVQLAWSKAVKAIVGSLAAASLLSFPAITWFVSIAQRRGSSILQERHERGATLVDKAVLVADVMAHNEREFRKAAEKLFPNLTPDQVHALPFADRKAAGLHHPYTLADIPYPYNLEASHTIVIGTTGAGKTTQLRQLVVEMRRRQHSAVIFDLTGAFVEAFYNPETDMILNPGDARCPTWSLFDDCTTQAEFTAASHAIVPNDGGSADPFWVVAARGLFVQMCLKLQSMGQTSNRALAENLMRAPLRRVHALLKGTSAEPYTATEAARLAESVRSIFNANAEALSSLPEDGPRFSIRDWIHAPDKPGSILFVTARHVDLPLYKMLLTLWLDIAVNTLMTLPRTSRLRTWFMFDELGALHRLPAIENGLQTARGFGGAMVLGLHSFARLQAVYGKEGAENLTSLARTKLILATADRKTAEQCAEFIGHREVRQMDEAYAYGSNNLRDASTLTPKKEIAPLVIPDDITNLPALHGFIKFPDGFPAARIVLRWRDYPEVARGFEPRTDPVRPIAHLEADDAEEGSDEGEEGEGRPRAIEKPEIATSKTRGKGRRAPANAKAVKDGKTAEETLKAAIPSDAEKAADDFVANFGLPEPLSPSPDAASPGPAPDAASKLDGDEQRDAIERSNASGKTNRPETPTDGPPVNKAGIRNEEHRQGIINNELGTDFGDENKPTPDDGMEMD
ncbi:MAG: type IV secretion system DNA-binding domain-containing protein [Sphingomonadaceae bacterium]|nr:type IV secretion system DNA-binding domain-containing protein [Sphingomonadaceae bacterium]